MEVNLDAVSATAHPTIRSTIYFLFSGALAADCPSRAEVLRFLAIIMS
jgi:hypothetical protein